MEVTLNVFSLNCWGIPVVSKNRKERFEALAKYLLNSSHNIVCLQEIWSQNDFMYLKENLKEKFPYAHYFYSGVLGSGLCVLSKWLIHDVFFHKWPLNGYIHKIHHGDWFGGKGIGLCRIQCNHTMINVYCTHLHAEYHEDDIYLAHRLLQAHATAEFVKLTAPSADVVVLAGDLNTSPGDLSYKIVTQLSSLLDPFDMEIEGTDPSIRRASGTSNNANNSYSDAVLASQAPEGKRIDHILFRTNDDLEVKILNFGNPLEDRVPGQPFSYSDHNAVSLELQIKPIEKRNSYQKLHIKDDEFIQTVKEAIKVCEEATANINKSKTLYLTVSGLLCMFLLGSIGFWVNNVMFDLAKFVMTALCFYCLMMGSLWSKIEINCIKAGLTALENINRSKLDNQHKSG